MREWRPGLDRRWPAFLKKRICGTLQACMDVSNDLARAVATEISNFYVKNVESLNSLIQYFREIYHIPKALNLKAFIRNQNKKK
jgi:hypothetical protein